MLCKIFKKKRDVENFILDLGQVIRLSILGDGITGCISYFIKIHFHFKFHSKNSY